MVVVQAAGSYGKPPCIDSVSLDQTLIRSNAKKFRRVDLLLLKNEALQFLQQTRPDHVADFFHPLGFLDVEETPAGGEFEGWSNPSRMMKRLLLLAALAWILAAPSIAQTGQGVPGASAPRYEYIRVFETNRWFTSNGDSRSADDYVQYSDGTTAKVDSTIAALNDAGAQGWEVVGVHVESGEGWRNVVYPLKRAKR